jgi:hypothetical protein
MGSRSTDVTLRVASSIAIGLVILILPPWACRARHEPSPVLRERIIELCQRALLERLPADEDLVITNPTVRRYRVDRFVVRGTLGGGGNAQQVDCRLVEREEGLQLLGLSVAQW